MLPPLSSHSVRRKRGPSHTFDVRWTAEEDRIVLQGREQGGSGSKLQKEINKLGLGYTRSQSAIRGRIKYLIDKREKSSQPPSTGASRSERQTVLSVASSPTPAGTRDAPIDIEKTISRSLAWDSRSPQPLPSVSPTANHAARLVEGTIVEPPSEMYTETASSQLHQRRGGQTRLNFARDKGKGKVQSIEKYAQPQMQPQKNQQQPLLGRDSFVAKDQHDGVDDTTDDIIHQVGNDGSDSPSHAEVAEKSVVGSEGDRRLSPTRGAEGLVDRETVPAPPGDELDETPQVNPAEIDDFAEPHAPSRVTSTPEPGSAELVARSVHEGQPTPQPALSTDGAEQLTSSRRSSGKLQRITPKRLSSTHARSKPRNRTVYGSGGIRRDTYDIFTLDANEGQWEVPPAESAEEGGEAQRSIEYYDYPEDGLPDRNGLASTGTTRDSPQSESRQSKWKFLVLSEPSMKRWQAAKKAAQRADETRSAYEIFLQEGWDDEMINAETLDEKLRVQRWRKRFERAQRDVSRKPQPPRNLRWPQYFPHHDRRAILQSVIRSPADEEIDRFDDEATTDDEFRDDKMIIDWPTNEPRPPLPATYRRLQIDESDDDDEADSDEEPPLTDEVAHARWEERETARLAEMSMHRRGEAEEVDETSSSDAESNGQTATKYQAEKAPDGVLSPVSRISIPCFGFNERGVASSPGLSSSGTSSRSQSPGRKFLPRAVEPLLLADDEAGSRMSGDVMMGDSVVVADDVDVAMDDVDEQYSAQSAAKEDEDVSSSNEASMSPAHNNNRDHSEELGDPSINLCADEMTDEDRCEEEQEQEPGSKSDNNDDSGEEAVADSHDDHAGEVEEDEKYDEKAEVESSDREDSAARQSPGVRDHEQDAEVGSSSVMENDDAVSDDADSDDEDSDDEENSDEDESPNDEDAGNIEQVARENRQVPHSIAETSPLHESTGASAEQESGPLEDEDGQSSDEDDVQDKESDQGDEENSSVRRETVIDENTKSYDSTASDSSGDESPAASRNAGVPEHVIKHEEIRPSESDIDADDIDSGSDTSDSSHESGESPPAKQLTVAKIDSPSEASDTSDSEEEASDIPEDEARPSPDGIKKPGLVMTSKDDSRSTDSSDESEGSEAGETSVQQKERTASIVPSQPKASTRNGGPRKAHSPTLPTSDTTSIPRGQVRPSASDSSISANSEETPTPKGQPTLQAERPLELEASSIAYASSPPVKPKIEPSMSRFANMANPSNSSPPKAHVVRQTQQAAPANLHKSVPATTTSSNITRASRLENDPETVLRLKKRHKKDKRLARLKRIHASFKANSTSFSDSGTGVSSPALPSAHIPTSSTTNAPAFSSSAVSSPTVRRSNAMTSASSNRKRAWSPTNDSPRMAPRIAGIGEIAPSSQDSATRGHGIAAQIRALSARLSSPPAVRKKSPVPTLPPSFLTNQDDDDDDSSSDSD